jgi:hypothetical protein
MKKFLLIFAFLPTLLSAQDVYTDMLAEGKTWSFIRWPYGNTHRMGMRGDSIINGMTWRKYGYVNDDGRFGCMAVFRQEGDKIYVKYNNSNDFSLAFDFGASVGDIVTIDNTRIEVTGTDTVTARGHELRQVSFKTVEVNNGSGWEPVEGDYGSSWIEGMGGRLGPLPDIPVPGLAGNYDMLMDIILGGELLCDANIFYGSGYEKMMLAYKPEWTYIKQVWDKVEGGWGDPLECRAMKTGMELPPPMNFPYTAVAVGEEQECKLLLRGNDQVYAEKNSLLEYMAKAFPEVDDVFTEPAYYPLDIVLYDFTLNVGDRYPCRGEVTVSSVSSLTTRDGISRRLLSLSNGLEILEGVGCLNSPYGVFAYQNDLGTESRGEERAASKIGDAASGSGIRSFRKYGSESEPIFVMGDIELGITPAKRERVVSGTIYDLQGRQLVSPPQKGIYIRNGKKFVVR